jgi:hypothetical protein
VPDADPQKKTFTSVADADAKFAAAGVAKNKHVIAYRGGGTSATIDLFLLHQLGFDDRSQTPCCCYRVHTSRDNLADQCIVFPGFSEA